MERPILVSADLIQPVQKGLKTETRRLSGLSIVNEEPDKWELIDVLELNGRFTAVFDYLPKAIVQTDAFCPYGKRGDILWVRENWFTQKPFDDIKPSLLPVHATAGFVADDVRPGWAGKTRPSIHMPRRFARIRLELLDVSIERLQSITEDAAIKEGVERRPGLKCQWVYKNYVADSFGDIGAVGSFETLWIKINGHASWDINPWVWALNFKRLA